jgi:4-hydroxy-tetrahydrodipicolinate synthase
LHRGIKQFVVNGATGEYCLTSSQELARLLRIASKAIGANGALLCGIGAASYLKSVEYGHIAQRMGVRAVLLPPPHFFRYQQQDLKEFCKVVASQLSLPVLLYNLPAFTGGLEEATVQALIMECKNIVGIKDSGGSLHLLRHLTHSIPDAVRVVGNDSVAAPALKKRLCDAVISGVACVLPELLQLLYAEKDQDNPDRFNQLAQLLNDFVGRLHELPVPWGLKWISEMRGMSEAHFSQPLSAQRIAQGSGLKKWFLQWETNFMQTIAESRDLTRP